MKSSACKGPQAPEPGQSQSENKKDRRKEKKCSIERIENQNKYKILIYNHRYPFVNDKEHLDNMISKNKECFAKSIVITILDKIENKNLNDIEQNNFIFNGGSSLYAYLIEVKNEN